MGGAIYILWKRKPITTRSRHGEFRVRGRTTPSRGWAGAIYSRLTGVSCWVWRAFVIWQRDSAKTTYKNKLKKTQKLKLSPRVYIYHAEKVHADPERAADHWDLITPRR